jgi:hypothetical protein
MLYILYFLLIFILIYWIELPYFISTKPLLIRRNPAEELENWLKSFDWGNRQEIKPAMRLPIYKFYTEVVEVLLLMARKMGGSYQESLLFLRESLQNDRQFEKKINDVTLGIYLQMGLMMVLTWGFIFCALSLVDVSVKLSHLILILLWQSIGLGLLPIILSWLRKKYFGDIGKIWKILFVLNSLAKVPLARTEIMSYAGIQDLARIKQQTLSNIVSKLKESCHKALKLGLSYEEDVKYLMEELRFQEKWHFEIFEKRLTVLKLILLSVFFLPSYLAFIFLLLGDLMAMM